MASSLHADNKWVLEPKFSFETRISSRIYDHSALMTTFMFVYWLVLRRYDFLTNLLRMENMPSIEEFDAEIAKAVGNEEFLRAHQLKAQKQVSWFGHSDYVNRRCDGCDRYWPNVWQQPQNLIDQIEARIKVLEAEKADAVKNEDYVRADQKKREVSVEYVLWTPCAIITIMWPLVIAMLVVSKCFRKTLSKTLSLFDCFVFFFRLND